MTLEEIEQREVKYFFAEGPRVCSACTPAHVENCPTCFGWGVYAATDGPISASGIEAAQRDGWRPCPTCGGQPLYVSDGPSRLFRWHVTEGDRSHNCLGPPSIYAGIALDRTADIYEVWAFGRIVQRLTQELLEASEVPLKESLYAAAYETEPRLRSLKCATVSLPGMEDVGGWAWKEVPDNSHAIRYLPFNPVPDVSTRLTLEAEMRRAVVNGFTFTVGRAYEIRTVYYTAPDLLPST